MTVSTPLAKCLKVPVQSRRQCFLPTRNFRQFELTDVVAFRHNITFILHGKYLHSGCSKENLSSWSYVLSVSEWRLQNPLGHRSIKTTCNTFPSELDQMIVRHFSQFICEFLFRKLVCLSFIITNQEYKPCSRVWEEVKLIKRCIQHI